MAQKSLQPQNYFGIVIGLVLFSFSLKNEAICFQAGKN